jgi:putative phage-type endonuclease
MIEQRSTDWHALRNGRITGTAFSDVMNFTAKGEPGAGRKNLITRLAVERITGQQSETYQNAAMRRGIELEPEARFEYECRSGELAEEVAFVVHPKYDFIGVSPDALIGADGMAEIKCPDSMHKHLSALLKGDHAQEYKWQILGQMWVCDRAWNDAVSYDPRFPEHLRLAICRVSRDESAIAELETQCLAVECEVIKTIDQLQRIAA